MCRKGKLFDRVLALGIGFFVLLFVCGMATSQEVTREHIVLGYHGWDSGRVNDNIAKFVIEKGLGYKTELIPADTIVLVTGLRRGDIDIDMEMWVENVQKAYDEGIAEGSIIDLGSDFPDSWQGFLVPTYVIKGDPERGIEPMAPDLKSVFDMPKYWKVFKDPEDPSKGRFYSCIPGWGCEKVNRAKIHAYGLDKTYNILPPGSDAALSGSMVAAYTKGKPWFGYYWAPTWPLGKLDMTPLEEPPYKKELWNEEAGYACAYPSVSVNIVVHSSLPKRAPDVVEFLKKYETSQAIHNKILAYMQDTGGKAEDGAIWFFKNYESLWTTWVSSEAAAKVKAALP
ncbi:MAG: ABC transporter substrate-binding protein [Proteobacteria bacterium]|nr:ABC transporter substrate-binding protein [Pseudomonadota bacterium]NIS68477.1 ABC transporter substrate-binding protein [Pseudomonadota bacterium]